MMPYYYGSGYCGGGIFGLIFWVAVVLFVVWLLKEGRHGRSWRARSEASDILKERYAKGEIDKREYEEKRKDLES